MLGLPVAGSAGAAPEASGSGSSAEPPGAATDPPAAAAAQEALAQVEDIIAASEEGPAAAEPERADLTLALRDLRLGLRHLDRADRRQARALLARPTDRNDEFAYDRPRQARNTCTVDPQPEEHLCLWWEPTGPHAPADLDTDDNGVPDFVDTARSELDLIWDRVVTRGGYRAPLPDEDGVDERLDVYLADIGGGGLYGFCAPEQLVQGLSASGYCVLDNDYAAAQFPSLTVEDNLRVTAAHEFFHAVQFAYDSAEDPWLMEGTAAWIEDEIYDQINDNQQFISGGTLTNPRVSLDASGGKRADFYHPWTWWRFLSEQHPAQHGSGLPVIIRDIWERVDATDRKHDQDSLHATVKAIASLGDGFTATVAAYGEAKRHPHDAFEEGAAWPTVPLIRRFTVRGGSRTSRKATRLPHLTSQTFSFVPGARTAGAAWHLKVPVDAPHRRTGSDAQVSVVYLDGRREVTRIALNVRGNGRIVVPFSSSQVERVELTLTNASQRYSCWHGTYLACRGRPLDDGRRTTFRGITVRR